MTQQCVRFVQDKEDFKSISACNESFETFIRFDICFRFYVMNSAIRGFKKKQFKPKLNRQISNKASVNLLKAYNLHEI